MDARKGFDSMRHSYIVTCIMNAKLMTQVIRRVAKVLQPNTIVRTIFKYSLKKQLLEKKLPNILSDLIITIFLNLSNF